jgi:hypothetical protein
MKCRRRSESYAAARAGRDHDGPGQSAVPRGLDRLNLAAEVSVRRDLDLDRTRLKADSPPPRAGHEWEMATDQLGTETRRSTVLIQPGRRYREQGEDHAGGCDGDRSWLAIREDDGWSVEADDGPEPPLPPLLRPG